MAKDNNSAPWISWWQDDIPCAFTPGRAHDNCQYLIRVLGSSFLAKARHSTTTRQHPLLENWVTVAAGPFIELNTLAEDLRVIEGVSGLASVLRDLRRSKQYRATLHVIHSAAMFARGENTLEKFYPQNHLRVPDFQIVNRSIPINVEAKILAASDCLLRFNDFASNLSQRILATMLSEARLYPSLTIVLKDVFELPTANILVNALGLGLKSFKGLSLEARTDLFNIFIDPCPQSAESFKEALNK